MTIKLKELRLEKDTAFGEGIEVEGNITGYYNLKVMGNIDALDINARDIDARDIICISRKKKSKVSKTIAYSITTDRFKRGRK